MDLFGDDAVYPGLQALCGAVESAGRFEEAGAPVGDLIPGPAFIGGVGSAERGVRPGYCDITN